MCFRYPRFTTHEMLAGFCGTVKRKSISKDFAQFIQKVKASDTKMDKTRTVVSLDINDINKGFEEIKKVATAGIPLTLINVANVSSMIRLIILKFVISLILYFSHWGGRVCIHILEEGQIVSVGKALSQRSCN